jgi:hypothetical protein
MRSVLTVFHTLCVVPLLAAAAGIQIPLSVYGHPAYVADWIARGFKN